MHIPYSDKVYIAVALQFQTLRYNIKITFPISYLLIVRTRILITRFSAQLYRVKFKIDMSICKTYKRNSLSKYFDAFQIILCGLGDFVNRGYTYTVQTRHRHAQSNCICISSFNRPFDLCPVFKVICRRFINLHFRLVIFKRCVF